MGGIHIPLDVPRSRSLGQDSSFWHGLRIRLKWRNGGKVSKEQSYWLEKRNQQGYRGVVCKGADEATHELTSYLPRIYSSWHEVT